MPRPRETLRFDDGERLAIYPRRRTGQNRERILADIDRDYIVRGDQAVEYGLVDHIIERRQLADRSLPITDVAVPSAA